jgi:hypothetical protein
MGASKVGLDIAFSHFSWISFWHENLCRLCSLPNAICRTYKLPLRELVRGAFLLTHWYRSKGHWIRKVLNASHVVYDGTQKSQRLSFTHEAIPWWTLGLPQWALGVSKQCLWDTDTAAKKKKSCYYYPTLQTPGFLVSHWLPLCIWKLHCIEYERDLWIH